MKINFKSPKKLILAIVTAVIVIVGAVLYDCGFINDEIYLKLISATSTETDFAPLEVRFIDVDQADCILIKGPKKNALIDAGNINYENRIENHLRSCGVHSIDIFIITHPHSDHLGSASKLLKKFPVGEVIIPKIPEEFFPTTGLFEEFIKAVSKKGCDIFFATADMSFDLGEGAVLSILGNTEYFGDNFNNYSVVSKLTFGETIFLFSGDAEKEVEQTLISKDIDLSADVYKAGHHGSTTSNSSAFLREINPRYAVIFCGKNNDYGHPHEEVLKRFKKLEAKVYRTDYDGDIVFGSDGINLTVKTEKQRGK